MEYFLNLMCCDSKPIMKTKKTTPRNDVKLLDFYNILQQESIFSILDKRYLARDLSVDLNEIKPIILPNVNKKPSEIKTRTSELIDFFESIGKRVD